MRPTTWLAVLALAAACHGGGGTAHAPVDPDLDLAIVVPADMKRVEVDFIYVERSPVFADGAAFAADQAAHNRSHTVSEPMADGDGWVVTLSRQGDPDLRAWYRPLGGGLAITCYAVRPFGPPTDEDVKQQRQVCFGTQRVGDGVLVPFRLSRTDKSTHVELAVVGAKLHWSVALEHPADSPAWRFDPGGADGRQKLLDRGSLDGGTWWISSGGTATGTHYDVVARRTIGGVELACYGDNFYDERYTRRQLALCRALLKP